jgi:flagellar biosynthetic protein FliP
MDAHDRAGGLPGNFLRWATALATLAVFIAAVPAAAQEKSGSDPVQFPLQVPQENSSGSPTANGLTPSTGSSATPSALPIQLPDLTKKENLSSAMQIIVLLTVLSLAPAILLMMTSFTRIVIVLSLLRQAIGTQQLPPNQILIGLSMFMTFLVMGPTWQRINKDAIQPYMASNGISQSEALSKAQQPIRDFMINNIKKRGNEEDVFLFSDFGRPAKPPKNWSDISTMTLVPAFMLSELKTAFLLGFQIYLPFLIIDMVISAVLISMGMMMLPPVLISLPFKLLLFVLVNGWHLITDGLLSSFVT